MPTTSETCANCGALIPPIAQMNIVRPWMWAGLCSILLGETPELKCYRCGHAIDMPSITVFHVPNHHRVHVVLGQRKDSAIISAIEEAMRQHTGDDLQFEIHADLKDLRAPITEHVLAYKPLLKELTRSQCVGDLPQFVVDRWRELTPLALAAGVVGVTGLVEGMGGYGINQKTGQRVEFQEMFKGVQEMLAEVQFRVWLRIISSDLSADYTLEDALSQHVLPNGAFGQNTEALRRTLESMKEDSETPGRVWYAGQALYASVAQTNEIENVFEADWCEAYMTFELALQDDSDSILTPFRISAQRAADTIAERFAWDSVARRLNREFTQDTMQSLDPIAERLGYKDLVSRVCGSLSLTITGSAGSLFDVVRTALDDPRMKAIPGWPVTPLRLFTESLVQSGCVELIDKVFDYVQQKIGNQHDSQAHLETWYGEAMKILRQPKRFIERVGEQPRNWEHDLTIKRRLDLWNERANAFRLLGRPQIALDLTEDLLKLIEGKEAFGSERFVLLRNRGILLREIGAVDASRRQLAKLLDQCRLEDKSSLLESYAATCAILGRYEEAIDTLQKAIEVAIKEKSTVERLTVSLALTYGLAHRDSDSLEALRKLELDTQRSDVISVVAAAYVNLLFHGVELNEDDYRHLKIVFNYLTEKLQDLESQGDLHLAVQNLAFIGRLAHHIKPEISESICRKQLALLQKQGRPGDPVALARLAAIAYRRQDRTEAIKLLQKLPRSLSENYGVISDISVAYDATRAVSASLNDLLKAAMAARAPWADCRLIAELKRDTIGKARLIQSRRIRLMNVARLEAGMSDEVVAAIAPCSGQMAVLELLDDGEGIFPMLTTVKSTGEVRTFPLGCRRELDIFALREQIIHRLSVWHEGRQGSPFDLPGWKELKSWLHDQIGKVLGDGEHVVIITHEDMVGLPFHVALGPRWRCSYASSWSVLLDVKPPQYGSPLRVGVFAAPRYHDAPVVREAIADAVSTTHRWAKVTGRDCDVYQDEQADRHAFERLMAECDVVTLFCHGYADPDDLEIALLVSSGGALPPMFAPGRPLVPDANRVSWRDLQSLPRTAPLVLSAACSTGLQWQAGAGEQMGLLGALRQGGTQSLVGPHWDITASTVLPLLKTVMSKHFDQRIPLVDALHETCVNAEKSLPRWLAWSLALEGRWL